MRIKSSKKTISKNRMIAVLDKACRQRIFVRDNITCQRCGKRDGEWDGEIQYPVTIQWCHVHTRRHYCLRWDDDGSFAGCERCHKWWHGNPILAFDWFSKKFPERWERIRRVLQINPKIHVKDLYDELLAVPPSKSQYMDIPLETPF